MHLHTTALLQICAFMSLDCAIDNSIGHLVYFSVQHLIMVYMCELVYPLSCDLLRPVYARAARRGLMVEPASSWSSRVPINSAIAVLARIRLGCSSSGSGRRRATPMREDGSMLVLVVDVRRAQTSTASQAEAASTVMKMRV